MKKIKPDSMLVHADRKLNQPQHGGVHEATNNSVLFDFADVADLEAVFQGKKAGHVYSRSSSTSAVALQNILAHLDGAIAATTFSTGMAAINALMFSLLKAGDHIIVSHFLFGNSRSFFDNLQNFAIDVSYVDVTDAAQVEAAHTTNTRLVFCETIANPGTQIADLINIGKFCQRSKCLFVVDNTMTPSVMFDARAVNANLLTTSLTKYVAGHGNVLGGAVIDMGNFDWSQYPNIDEFYKSSDAELWGTIQIRKKGLRDLGATLAPESAHTISVGLETLTMRMQKCCKNALELARYLQSHPKILSVNYPGLSEHKQHKLAEVLFSSSVTNSDNQATCYGAILSFELDESIDIRGFLNQLDMILRATHLGDNRTLALPVASTIFYENGKEKRKQMGISDTLIRISVGIEDVEDLIDDFEKAFYS